VDAATARAALDELTRAWGKQYGAIIRLSENARCRRVIKPVAASPHRAGGVKRLYLVTRSLDPTGTGRSRWAMRWKTALNAFAIAIAFGDRFLSAGTF
jgi:putative transposase